MFPVRALQTFLYVFELFFVTIVSYIPLVHVNIIAIHLVIYPLDKKFLDHY